VGNIVCGGAGKTPTAIALQDILEKRGYKVHFVTRGYGGRARGPVKVDPVSHRPCDVGDEPLLLARHAPTWVAKKRFEGIEKAIEGGAQLIILDDGHQTTSVVKDVSLVVFDALQGVGNGYVAPSGPLREELSEGLKRADGIMEIGSEEIEEEFIITPHPSFCQAKGRVRGNNKPIFKAKIVPQPLQLPSQQVVAFCGLGFPQKFYNSLKELGLDLKATESFSDHYQYTEDDLLRLQTLAQKRDAVLVTTQKDFVKIPPRWQKKIHVLDIMIEFEDPEALGDFVLGKCF
jgi:tetraacyldisaccharide 4'-kinase